MSDVRFVARAPHDEKLTPALTRMRSSASWPRWTADVATLADAMAEIVINPITKTGVMRVNAGLAALVAAGQIGVDDLARRPVRPNERPQDANGRQRGAKAWPRNANDRPEGRSWASGIEGNARCSKSRVMALGRLSRFNINRPNETSTHGLNAMNATSTWSCVEASRRIACALRTPISRAPLLYVMRFPASGPGIQGVDFLEWDL